MSALRLIVASLVYHWRTNLAVACGVGAGTAVLTGALLVGDSMRGSLRHLTLDRLGQIDEALLTERLFRVDLADELARKPEFKEHFSQAVAVVLLRASLEQPDRDPPRRANRVNLIGCDRRFWNLGSGRPNAMPKGRQIVLNQPLAQRLGVAPGDRILLRLPRVGLVPGDSLLGRKSETVKTSRLTVSQIIPAEGLGRFSLRASQQLPPNAYVSIDWLRGQLNRPGQANSILVVGHAAEPDTAVHGHSILQRLLEPTLDDEGIRVQRTPHGYLNITSDRMLLEPAVEAALSNSLDGCQVQPALTYLANTIACKDAEIPYSTITAVDFTDQPAGIPDARQRFLAPDGRPIRPPAEDEIVLNSWAAEDLGARRGDVIRVSYYEPESTHGQLNERSVDLRLAGVVELAGAAADPDFTPSVPGITDQPSMADWDPPFPFDAKRIREKDEQYWEAHGATPKAFVALATGRRLWGSRFGQTTSIRVWPRDGMSVADLQRKLAGHPAPFGFVFQPVKSQGLAASAGTTDFNLLFLGFSGFIIAAAMMLVALLFRLGVQQRAGEIGTLLAVGFGRRKIARLLAGEGLLIATLGSLLGVPAGIGYAALMLLGLRTWWLRAVVTPFLELYVTWTSLAVGFASGVVVALLAILWTVWRTRHLAPKQLLAGRPGDTAVGADTRPRYIGGAAWILLIAATAIGLLAVWIGRELQAGLFFATGAMVLMASLMLVWIRLRSGTTGPAVARGRGNVLRVAVRNAARNPGRSSLTIGLVASACFLIVAVSAFRIDATQQVPTLRSGNGGFALVAQSDQPIYQDISTPTGRADLGFSPQDSAVLAETTTISLRVKPGDDASCLNLYRPQQPRVLGLPWRFINRGGFAWAGSAASTPAQRENPLLLLEEELGTDADGTPLVPVVIGKNTATYSLHLGFNALGKTYDIRDSRGGTTRLKVVGLLSGSIFQGDLLISQTAFLRIFPEVSGYRFFLIEAPPSKTESVATVLERTLGDYGLATQTTADRLADFLAVQNTYLSTFQSLGGLGLLLGTFALAAVQLRSVLERRGELAVLRAAGFRRITLAEMVLLENGLLLCAGLGCGLLAALVAVLPHWLRRDASIPWLSLGGTLALVLVVGLVAGLAGVRATLRAPLLAALREER
ncbi:MAG: hypothetical protein A2V70_03445 [Planctomycetes bacterium RBG_13_63_9]|nr:MAG: hypothetical protein A2V70_03445 [Planctomycetes bacterium RBG_13_63_9]